MRTDRAIAGILAACVLLVLALGVSIRQCARPNDTAPADTPTPQTPTPAAPAATPGVAGPPPAARGHRLAGTVVGDVRYAIIEDPSGADELYRPGQIVPDLGRLLAVESDRATFAGSAGTFELRIAAAPTATAKPPTEPPRRRTATPAPPPRDGRSASESSPSDESDR